jgi:hypothetical protein
MYVVRDVFRLQFGHYKDVKALLKEVQGKDFIPQAKSMRMLTDFTGDSYRLVFEAEFDSLASYEKGLQSGMGEKDWQKWYEQFKQHVLSSYREILKIEA